MRSRRGVVSRVVQVQLGEQQVRVEELAVDLESLGRGGGGGRRILIGQHARESGVRRRPFGIELQRILERAHRFGRADTFRGTAVPSLYGLPDRRWWKGAR